jgi:hypothetical protein
VGWPWRNSPAFPPFEQHLRRYSTFCEPVAALIEISGPLFKIHRAVERARIPSAIGVCIGSNERLADHVDFRKIVLRDVELNLEVIEVGEGDDVSLGALSPTNPLVTYSPCSTARSRSRPSMGDRMRMEMPVRKCGVRPQRQPSRYTPGIQREAIAVRELPHSSANAHFRRSCSIHSPDLSEAWRSSLVRGMLKYVRGVPRKQVAFLKVIYRSRIFRSVQIVGYPDDRRFYSLHLAQAGGEALERIGRVAREHQNALLSALSKEERDQLADLLLRIADQQGHVRGVHPGYQQL